MKMVVVGDGPMMNSLRSEFPDAVFCGMRRGEGLARHYAAMDVLLFASETETFGNVLLEGMASGLATVSYRYAASADVVLDGINGLQAEKGDEEGFYSAMRRLLEDGEMIRRLGKQARRTVNSRTWDSARQHRRAVRLRLKSQMEKCDHWEFRHSLTNLYRKL